MAKYHCGAALAELSQSVSFGTWLKCALPGVRKLQMLVTKGPEDVWGKLLTTDY